MKSRGFSRYLWIRQELLRKKRNYSGIFLMTLTKADREIIKLMQEDATITLAALSERVGLSQSSTQRRLQKLRDEKVILHR